MDGFVPEVYADGPTPATALRALAAALEAMSEPLTPEGANHA